MEWMKRIVYGNEPGELRSLGATSDGHFMVGEAGVEGVLGTGDGKVEFIGQSGKVLGGVRSALGYPAYYPVEEVKREGPVEGVLMDLDGTSVESEEFWIWIIEQTVATVMGDRAFTLEEADIPHVSGHSVSEHLEYCIGKYCAGKSRGAARGVYFEHTREQMAAILTGKGRAEAFVPKDGLKEFLRELKGRGIKIGLVTSGLHEKAWPEIVAAFRTMGMGSPADFYDTIITAGNPLRQGAAGTLGELCPKPHPWLYAEAGVLGLGIPHSRRGRIIGIEDSGAGVCSIRLAGYACMGLRGGNIVESGTRCLCHGYADSLAEILPAIV